MTNITLVIFDGAFHGDEDFSGIIVVSMGTTSKAEMSFRAVTDVPALADL